MAFVNADSQFFQWYTGPYTAPFSFQVRLSTGQVMTGTNVLSSFPTSESGEISMAGGIAFVNADSANAMNGEDAVEQGGLSSGAIAGLVIVGVMVGCLMGALCMVCYQKKKNRRTSFFFSYSRHTCYTFICAIKKLGNIPHCIHVVVCRVSGIPSYELGIRF